MIVEISLRPSFSPVTAVTVTKRVIVGAGVGDELLRAVDHPFTAVQARGGAGGPGIRSRFGLGEAEARKSLTGEQIRQQLGLLRVGAEAEHRHRAEADSGFERDRQGLVDPPERFDRETQREIVTALTSELLGERQAEQAELAHLRDDVQWQGLRAICFVRAAARPLRRRIRARGRRAALIVGQVVVLHVEFLSLPGRS